MSQIDYENKQISSRILYFGPTKAGKLTLLKYIHKQLDPANKMDFVELRSGSCRLFSFDLFALNVGEGNKFKTRFSLQALATAELDESAGGLLKNIDGVIFVADSDPERANENIDFWRSIEADLVALNIPCVLLYNKRDLHNAMPLNVMDADLRKGALKRFEGIATEGLGVHVSLKSLTHSILNRLSGSV